MFLRWWRRRDPLERAWKNVTSRLGLVAAEDGTAVVTEMLDLPGDVVLGAVHRLDRAGDLQAYAFWYRRSPHSRSREQVVVIACLLVAASPISPVSWRASRKLHNVIASLQASATGGEVIAVEGAEEFNQRVTVVAREGERLRGLLTPAVRRVLERAVTRLDPPPAITVGESSILLAATSAEPALDTVEFLLSDVLSLYAALNGDPG
ncbi:MAG: hypothetical protein WD314_11535 [Trueperaceae bacterium]